MPPGWTSSLQSQSGVAGHITWSVPHLSILVQPREKRKRPARSSAVGLSDPLANLPRSLCRYLLPRPPNAALIGRHHQPQSRDAGMPFMLEVPRRGAASPLTCGRVWHVVILDLAIEDIRACDYCGITGSVRSMIAVSETPRFWGESHDPEAGGSPGCGLGRRAHPPLPK